MIGRDRVSRNFLVFAGIGGIGFVAEFFIISLVTHPWIGIPVIWARFISFPIAVTVTWLLNRIYNFRSKAPPVSEGMRYFAVQICGGLTNLGVFICLVYWNSFLEQHVLIPLFLAACAGLIINFTGSNLYVFDQTKNNRLGS